VSNRKLGVPEFYEPLDLALDCGPFANAFRGYFDSVDHYSRYVSAETNAGNMQAITPEE
jgi:hypothetical protein